MTNLLVIAATIFALELADNARAACGGDCDATYSSDVDSCHGQYGEEPEDAADLAQCIQSARDDYSSCVEACANRD